MIEPLFGSGSQTWPMVPSPGLGWPQLTAPLGNRTIGGAAAFGSPQISPMPPGLAAGQQSSFAPAFAQPSLIVSSGTGFPIVPGPFGVAGGGFSAFVPPEVATGATIRALLETVAMRRGQPHGPTNDQECEDFVYDTFEMVPAASEVDVRCEGGRITLTGSVQYKRLKHDIGELAWAIPNINDVQNNITIVSRRRPRGGRDAESPAATPGRKTA